MQRNAVFFAWNRSVPGREETSGTHFDEFVGYLSAQAQAGTIQGFDVVFLDPHGGDMNGFFLIKGEPRGHQRPSLQRSVDRAHDSGLNPPHGIRFGRGGYRRSGGGEDGTLEEAQFGLGKLLGLSAHPFPDQLRNHGVGIDHIPRVHEGFPDGLGVFGFWRISAKRRARVASFA